MRIVAVVVVGLALAGCGGTSHDVGVMRCGNGSTIEVTGDGAWITAPGRERLFLPASDAAYAQTLALCD